MLNTENACASGTAAAHLAWLAVASGRADVALALGVEKLHHPDKSRSFAAIQSATDVRENLGDGITGGSVAMGEYAREARAWAVEHGDIATALAAIAVKNRAYASSNAYAQFRAPTTADDVLASRVAAGVPGQRPHRP